jgi:hypothetical protein
MSVRFWAGCTTAMLAIAVPAAHASPAPLVAVASPARPLAPALTSSQLPGTCKGPLVVISDEARFVVDFYEQKGFNRPPCFELNYTDGLGGIPGGLFVDHQNHLFVGRGRVYDRGEVLEYRPPYTGVPKRVCTTETGFPWGLAVDTSGTVYAGDNDGYTNLQNQFTRCKRGRSNQIIDPNLDDGRTIGDQFFFATDAQGNLFDDGWDSSQTVLVDESTDGGVTWTNLQNLGASRYPGGLEIDPSGNLFLNDDGRFGSAGNMLEITPPYTGPPTVLFSYTTNDVPIALKQGGGYVWSIAGATQGVEYDLGTGKVIATTAALSDAIGIATIPSDAP